MELKKLLGTMKKNAIEIELCPHDDTNFPIGATKFGGIPDVPKWFEWPYYEGEGYHGIVKNRPLTFLAQFNLEEVKPYDAEGVLPEAGMLYFFYELATMKWGFDPEDRGCFKVVYAPPGEKLYRAKTPPLSLGCKMPRKRILMKKAENLPGFEEVDAYYHLDDFDEYAEACTDFGIEEKMISNKLLGYADLIQGEMLLECQLASNGIYCGEEFDMPDDEYEKAHEAAEDWTLLFQLDSIHDGDFELDFFENGRIYFYIRKQDLKAKNFDNCWLVLQCC